MTQGSSPLPDSLQVGQKLCVSNGKQKCLQLPDLGLSLFVWWEDILNAIKYVLKSLNRGKLKTRKYKEKYLSCQNGNFTEFICAEK